MSASLPTVCVCARTGPVRDVDRRAGRRTVPSAGHGVDGDDVISPGLQIIDRGSRLSSRNSDLFWITVSPWMDSKNQTVKNAQRMKLTHACSGSSPVSW